MFLIDTVYFLQFVLNKMYGHSVIYNYRQTITIMFNVTDSGIIRTY